MPLKLRDKFTFDQLSLGEVMLRLDPSEGRIREMDIPTTWSKSQPELRMHAPRLGEHSAEVLSEAGYSEAEINDLRTAGVTNS